MTCLVPEHCRSYKFCLQWSKFCYEGFEFLILTKQTTFPRGSSGLHSLRSQCRSYLRLFGWPGDPVLPFGGWGGYHIAAVCLAPGKRPRRRSTWNFPSWWLHITNRLNAGVLLFFFSQVKTQITEDFGTFSHDGFMVQVCAVLSIFSTMGSVFY